MKLTHKDARFLRDLRALLNEDAVRVVFREDGLKRFILRQNYGTATVENRFGITRQGVRWRFQRIFGDLYVSAYDYAEPIVMCS